MDYRSPAGPAWRCEAKKSVLRYFGLIGAFGISGYFGSVSRGPYSHWKCYCLCHAGLWCWHFQDQRQSLPHFTTSQIFYLLLHPSTIFDFSCQFWFNRWLCSGVWPRRSLSLDCIFVLRVLRALHDASEDWIEQWHDKIKQDETRISRSRSVITVVNGDLLWH